MYVKAKKHLGQHFLKDASIAEKIARSLTCHGNYQQVIEVGPGTGALTRYLLEDARFTTSVVEIDRESIHYLNVHYPQLHGRILEEDFLAMDFRKFPGEVFAVAGNFPYNISSQIMFRVYENRDLVSEVVGMFQKEVAERICEKPGKKTYGILSVLLQAFYECEYLFTVSENVFQPPPKVKSGVIRLKRNNTATLDCDEVLFKNVVKTCFNQRRKTVRNSIKTLNPLKKEHALLDMRPEQLGVEEFVILTNLVSR